MDRMVCGLPLTTAIGVAALWREGTMPPRERSDPQQCSSSSSFLSSAFSSTTSGC